MEHLLFTLNAILPIILPILLGYFLKRMNFFKKEFLVEANKLVFKILIPVALFVNLYMADLSHINWAFVGFASLAILLLFGIGLVVTLFFSDKRQKGVILQAAFRSNYAIIGIPLATALGGAVAEAEASVVAAISVPLFNILAVIALSIFHKEEGKKVNFKQVLLNIAKNPLILGVFAGLAVCLINMGITALGFDIVGFLNNKVTFIPKTLNSIKGCMTPIALLVLGARFEFSAIKSLWKQITTAVVLRLFITPAIFLSLAYVIGFRTSTDFAILSALFATPIAVSSVPMTAQMGQDDQLAGQIVVWTSTISAFSLFLIIYLCSQIGIFAI